MKPRWQKQCNRALTMPELLVVIAVLVVLGAMLLLMRDAGDRHPVRIMCVSNLKQVALSFRIWEGDHNNEYPMAVSTSLGGARELVAVNNVAACFRVMSNELSTPRILICPEDTVHTIEATNFSNDFNASRIS